MNNNLLRSPDPINPFPKSEVREPSRLLPKPSIRDTVLVRMDAVRVYRSSALSVANNDFISWDSVIPNPQTALLFDTTGIWNGNNTFTIPLTGKVTGVWTIKCQIGWPTGGAGVSRQVAIIRNGSAITHKASPITILDQDISDVIYNPSPGDTIKIQVYHDAGGSLALTVGSSRTFCSIIHTG